MTTKQKILTNIDIVNYLEAPIYHKDFNEALDFINESYSSFGLTPISCYITGPSGTGKTTLAKTAHLEILSSAKSTTERTNIPVVRVTLTDGALPDDVRRDILIELGVDPSGYAGAKLKKLLIKQLNICGVKLVIFDEFQHLLRPGGKNVNKRVCEFVKTFIDTTRRPVVLLGNEDGKKLFKLYPELRTRFVCGGELSEMNCITKRGLDYFTWYLEELMKLFPLKSLDLSKGDFPYRVALATNGNLRTLEYLLTKVLKNNRSNQNEITAKAYQAAYEVSRQSAIIIKGKVVAPFTADINTVRELLGLPHEKA